MGILSFLNRYIQKNKIPEYKNLSTELQNQFRNELQRNPDNDFNTEFIRTTNLENTIINQYGIQGIKLVLDLQNKSNFYLLGKFPKDCPWIALNNKSKKGFIDENFKSISDKIPNLLASLNERCQFIYAEQKEDTWYLHYLLAMKLHDGRNYFRVYTGGAPLSKPEANKNLKTYHWDIPTDLKAFYTIHNGFGEIKDSNYIMANEDIKIMAEMMDPICKDQNLKPTDYSFDDLLEFFPDGAGNAQCFYKKNNNSTFDWDHEVWEISGETDFFEFIDERMSEIDEE